MPVSIVRKDEKGRRKDSPQTRRNVGVRRYIHTPTMSGKPAGWYAHLKLYHPRAFFPFGYLVSLRRDNSPHFYARVNSVSQPDVSGNSSQATKTSTLCKKYYTSILFRKKIIKPKNTLRSDFALFYKNIGMYRRFLYMRHLKEFYRFDPNFSFYSNAKINTYYFLDFEFYYVDRRVSYFSTDPGGSSNEPRPRDRRRENPVRQRSVENGGEDLPRDRNDQVRRSSFLA